MECLSFFLSFLKQLFPETHYNSFFYNYSGLGQSRTAVQNKYQHKLLHR